MKTNNAKKGTVPRLLKMIAGFYPVMFPATIALIIFNAIVSSIPAVFMQNIIAVVESSWQSGDWSAVSGQIFRYVGILVCFYAACRLYLQPADGHYDPGNADEDAGEDVQQDADPSHQVF